MVSRRAILGATAAGAVGVAGGLLVRNSSTPLTTATQSIEFRGEHQAGIALELQAYTTFVALNLNPGTGKSDMLRLMSLLTDDIERLSKGQPVLADPHPELVSQSARMTATLGFGPTLFSKLGLEDQLPAGFAELPSFKIDRLEPRYSGGDVLLHVSSDDPIYLSHAVRMLVLDAQAFATVHFAQQGFAKTLEGDATRTKQRNLMGQIDGTDNPEPNTDDFNNLVWIKEGPAWAVGGTTLVLRRIAMALNTWDALGRASKQEVIGRTLDNGAPLGGMNETDFPDFEATGPTGLKVIPQFAHIRRATAYKPEERFFRRPFNYDAGFHGDNEPDVGLLWTAYAKNLEQQYLPVQRRLEQFDLLNKWTTPIGSSVWVLARGAKPGEILAEQLFS